MLWPPRNCKPRSGNKNRLVDWTIRRPSIVRQRETLNRNVYVALLNLGPEKPSTINDRSPTGRGRTHVWIKNQPILWAKRSHNTISQPNRKLTRMWKFLNVLGLHVWNGP